MQLFFLFTCFAFRLSLVFWGWFLELEMFFVNDEQIIEHNES